MDTRADPVEQQLVQDRQERIVAHLLRRLDDRERRILAGRFGIGGAREETLSQIGAELGISKERVRQVGRVLWTVSAGLPARKGESSCRPRPNTRVTKGKLEGRHFAEWAKGEAKEAKSRDEESAMTSNRGDFVSPDAKAKF